ncbi:MAG: hypothetical protein HQ498_13495 [Pseudohongiella sp.]|nr:hypothetical protein [Pseudohongiella sp.]
MTFNKMRNSITISFSLLLIAGVSYAANESKKVDADAEDFNCLAEMTATGNFFVDNLLGNLPATVAAASSDDGGRYPAGSVVSLIPTEVMLKHNAGWNADTNDWEFIELTVSAAGSVIKSRGTTEVINQFGGNCFDCHSLARPEWDFVCGTGHGCAPLPITRETIIGIQKGDPRCSRKE